MSGMDLIEPYPLPADGDLPANTVDWTIEPDRAVLLIHDMQRYFLRPFPDELAGALLANCVLLRDRAVVAGVPIAYTAQPGGMSEQERGLLKDFWGPGMRVDPADRQIVDPLRPADTDWIFTKWRYSAFHHSDLLARMWQSGRDQLVLCGVYAHVGVLMTAIDAFSHDIKAFLVADAIADFSAEHHRMAMSYAASRCAVVTTAKEVLA
jgi:isochorismate hydrolase